MPKSKPPLASVESRGSGTLSEVHPARIVADGLGRGQPRFS